MSSSFIIVIIIVLFFIPSFDEPRIKGLSATEAILVFWAWMERGWKKKRKKKSNVSLERIKTRLFHAYLKSQGRGCLTICLKDACVLGGYFARYRSRLFFFFI